MIVGLDSGISERGSKVGKAINRCKQYFKSVVYLVNNWTDDYSFNYITM